MPDNKPDKKIKVSTSFVVRIALVCVFATVFVVSAVMLINTLAHYRAASELYGKVQSEFDSVINKTTGAPGSEAVSDIWTRGPGQINVPEVTTEASALDTTAPSDNTPTTSDKPANTTPSTPEPVYSERFLKACDFIRDLKKINDDVVGYIYIEFANDPAKNISYPLVQGDDDTYYVDHAYDNSELKAGAIFLDFRCSDRLERNWATLVHGHNMNNGAMFHNLKYLKQKEYFNNVSVSLYTLNGIYSYEVFSVYNTENTGDYSTIFFESDTKFVSFLEAIQQRSFFSKELAFYNTDHILTLSTCLNTNLNGRLAVHAILTGISQ